MTALADGVPPLRTTGLTEPWELVATTTAQYFRGRILPGTVPLPAAPLPQVGRGTTFGLAGAPVTLRALGASYRIGAGVPWALPSDGRWRLVAATVTDLRLVHVDAQAVGAPVTHRPLRFEGPESAVMRSAIRTSAPVWIDGNGVPLADLGRLGPGEAERLRARLVSPGVDHDATTAFLLMATWAIGRLPREEDVAAARVLAHIEANLDDPALGTASVAARHRLSRRTVQSMLAPYGGTAAYIRRQRLAAVVRHLVADPETAPDLDAVARATGLGSRRTLERAMRQVHGVTPRQARAIVLGGGTLRERPPAALAGID